MPVKKLVVIGAGPGGFPAALKARELGMDVVVVEKEEIGGVCLNWGCIPSKSYLDAAHRVYAAKNLGFLLESGKEGLADSLTQAVSWEKIKARREAVVEKLKTGLQKNLEAKGIKIIKGTASFVPPAEIEIKTEAGVVSEKFDAAVIATGTEAFLPAPFDVAADKVLDNKKVFSLARKPRSVAIIGGGVIGSEFACFFNALGCEVNVVEMAQSILPLEDENVSRAVQGSFQKRKINIYAGRTVKEMKAGPDIKELVLSDGSVIKAEEVMVAVGRTMKLEALGLDKAGVVWDKKTGVKVDAKLKTSAANIYAVGDVNGLNMLAHAASAQGEIAAENISGAQKDYENSLIPRCIYTWPEAASVGMTKKEMQGHGIAVKISRAFFAGSGRAMTQDETEGFIMVLSDNVSGQIHGASLVGVCATEMVHIFSVAIKAGMKTADMKNIVFAHPTMSESIHDALLR